MADYGVNIAVAVKNTEAITALTRKIKLTTSQVGQLNNFLVNFNDWRLGPAVVNSVDNFNKALKDARDNLNSVALGNKEAADAARDFARAQDLANEALREQAELLAQVRNEGRSGTLRGGTQYSGPAGPGFSGLVSRQASETALSSRLPPSVPVALRSPMRPQSLLPQMGMTAQAGKIASDMEEVYASILRLTEKANQEEAERLQTLRQGTKEVEELAQKYRAVNEAQKTGKELQLQIRRNVLETKQAAAEEARIANQGLLDRLRNLEAVGAERRQQFIEFNKEEEEKRRIRLRELDFEQRLARNRERKERRKRATGSALIGGAFPLLFGQGLGAAGGGALGGFGGGLIGGEFGFGLSLVGTQVGTQFDALIQNAVELGQALDPLTADTERIIEAVGKTNTKFSSFIAELEQAGESTRALELATKELEKVVGVEGVEALELFSAGVRDLQNEFAVFVTQLSAVVAKAINDLRGETSFVREVRERSKAVFEARQSKDPEIVAAVAELDALGPDPKARIAQQEKIVELLERAQRLQSQDIGEKPEKLAQRLQGNRELIQELEQNLELSQAVNQLDRDKLVAQNRLEKSMERVREIQDDENRATAGFLVLKQYQADITRAETEERERQEKIQDRTNKKAESERRKADRVRQAAERKLERQRLKEQRAFERNERALLRLQQRGEEQRERAEAAQIEKAGALIDKLSTERELRLAILNGTEEQVERQQRINELMVGQEEGMRSIVEQYVDFEIAETKAVENARELKQTYENIGDSIKDGVVDAITAAVDRTRTLGEVASNVLRNIANQLLRLGVNQLFGAFNFGGGGNTSTGPNVDLVQQYMGGKALGGAVGAGRSYLVGERGPELFVPGAQGNIVPNNAMGGSNIVVNVDASGSSVEGDSDQAAQLGKMLGAAVQAELVKQKRPGGLLAS